MLYLGRPTDSVIVEAYRHLVDPLEDPMPASGIAPRVLITADVRCTQILDLRTALGRANAGLNMSDLTCATDDRDGYARCQEVAQIAHQLGRHGLITPAATELGETLALFMDLVPEAERPVRSADDKLWSTLPPDPRAAQLLRLVRDDT